MFLQRFLKTYSIEERQPGTSANRSPMAPILRSAYRAIPTQKKKGWAASSLRRERHV
jgi:hypothetical protein